MNKFNSGYSQTSLDEIMKEDFRKEELKKPWDQQVSSAQVVMFVGMEAVVIINGKDYPKRIPKGTLGFVNGSRSGYFDTHITTRSMNVWVSCLDLRPLKVIPFEEESK